MLCIVKHHILFVVLWKKAIVVFDIYFTLFEILSGLVGTKLAEGLHVVLPV